MSENTCAITWASGYEGSRVKDYLGQRGWVVYELAHNLEASYKSHPCSIPYTLEEGVVPDALQKVQVLIHCAYDFRQKGWERICKVKLEGSRKLFDAARIAGVRRFVLISTISAFKGFKSLYGRAKMAIEQEASSLSPIVIRPGLIFGKKAGGMFGALRSVISSSRVSHLIGRGNQTLYLAHEEDLRQLILEVSSGRPSSVPKPILAACEKGMTLRTVLKVLARAQGRQTVLIPVPWRFIWGV